MSSFLTRWFKKQKDEQLEKVSKAGADVKEPAVKETSEAKPAIVKQEKKKESKPAAAAISPVRSGDKKSTKGGLAFKVIIKSMVTEKSAVMESRNKYSFVIAKWAGKTHVKQAIEELYGIKPLDVNVMNIGGRRVRFGRTQGRRSDYKKAIVTLPQGKSITVHTGV